jgi:hypothetical protein
VGRTIPSWRMVVEAETAKLKKFRDSLRLEDKVIFDDLLDQCKLYASAAGSLASPVKEVPLIISMVFAQHKKLAELERRVIAKEENTFG